MDQAQIKYLRAKLRQFDRFSGGVFEAQTDCCGLTKAQCHTLLEIGMRDKVSLVELAGGLGLDTSTLSRTIQGLVMLGLVRRRPSETDRRYVEISLSSEGRGVFDRIESLSTSFYARVLESFPEEKRKDILSNVEKFVDAVLKLTESGCCVEEEVDEDQMV